MRARVKNTQEVVFTSIRTTFAFTVAQFQLHFISVYVYLYVCIASFLDILLLLLLLLHAFVVGEGGQIRSVALAFIFFFCTIFELNCRNFYLACLLYLSVEHVTSN